MDKKRISTGNFVLLLLAVAVVFTASALLYLQTYNVTILWKNLTLFAVLAAASGLLPGLLAFFGSKFSLGKKTSGSIVRGIICLAISEALIFGLLTVNNSFFNGRENKLFAGLAFFAIGIMTLCLILVLLGRVIAGFGAKRVLAGVLAAVVLLASPSVCLLVAVASLEGRSTISAVCYTDGEPIVAERRDYCFDNSSLLIGGYCWADNDNNPTLVTLAKQAGLDFLISNCTDNTFLSACDEQNLGIILSEPGGDFLPRSFQTTSDKDFEKWKTFTAADYAASPLYSHKCIWGNSFVDEPFRPYFEGIAEGVENYYANTDGKLPYVNQVPFTTSANLGLEADMMIIRSLPLLNNVDWINDTVARYKTFISDYINTVDTDYLCFDIYPLKIARENISGEFVFGTHAMWLRNLDLLSEACRQTNRDLWVITQASGEVDDSGEVTDTGARYTDTPEDIRWQYYVSLSFGAKAIINALYYSGWWEPDSHMINSEQQITDTYRAVQTVNKEFAPITEVYGNYMSLGAFLTNGDKSAANKTNTLCPPVSEAKLPVLQSDDPILTGCFRTEDSTGNAYTFVNMWEPGTGNSASAEIKFDGATEITVYRKGQIKTVSGDTLSLTLENSEGVFVTVK